MQAIILVGGLGTRLKTLYPDRPKALVPILGQPFIERQIAWLCAQGITSVHLAAGHKAVMLADWARDWKSSPVPLTVSVEPQPLGTAGGLKFVEPFVRGEVFLALNGDSLLPRLDIPAMLRAHRETCAVVSDAITRIEESGRYGTVEFDSQNRLTAFLEKAERTGGWVNGGVYAMNREVLDLIDPEQILSLETDIFPALTAAGTLRVFQCAPPLLDMGTPDGIRAMEDFLAAAKFQ